MSFIKEDGIDTFVPEPETNSPLSVKLGRMKDIFNLSAPLKRSSSSSQLTELTLRKGIVKEVPVERDSVEFDHPNVQNILRHDCRPQEIKEAAEQEDQKIKEILSQLPRGGMHADIGCGDARMARYLHGLYGVYHGYEISKEMVRIARASNERASLANILEIDDQILTGLINSVSDLVTKAALKKLLAAKVVYKYHCEQGFTGTNKGKEVLGIFQSTEEEKKACLIEDFAADLKDVLKIIGDKQNFSLLQEANSRLASKFLEQVSAANINARIIHGDAATTDIQNGAELYDAVYSCFQTAGNFWKPGIDFAKLSARELEALLSEMPEFIKIMGRFYRSLKSGGKLLFTVYRGDSEADLAAAIAQRSFYTNCGLKLISHVADPVVSTQEGFNSRRWKNTHLDSNLLASCIVKNPTFVKFHDLGQIVRLIEVTKPESTEILPGKPLIVIPTKRQIREVLANGTDAFFSTSARHRSGLSLT